MIGEALDVVEHLRVYPKDGGVVAGQVSKWTSTKPPAPAAAPTSATKVAAKVGPGIDCSQHPS